MWRRADRGIKVPRMLAGAQHTRFASPARRRRPLLTME